MTQNKSVLLIEPPRIIYGKGETKRHGFPLGLGYLAAALESKKIPVTVLDCVLEGYDQEQQLDDNMYRYGLSDQAIEEAIISIHPSIIGISHLFSDQTQNIFSLCSLIKKINPDIVTILGGNHATALPEHLLSDKNVDIVVMGEGEHILPELVHRITNGQSFHGLDGFGFKQNGSMTINKGRSYIQDLDSLPFPGRHLFPFEKYFSINSTFGDSIYNVVVPAREKQYSSTETRYTNILTSRGCQAKCIFCSSPHMWGRFRARSPENVLIEIEELIDRYAIEELHFQDNNITADIRRAEQIFKGMIERQFGLHWTTPNGIALYRLTPSLIELMKRSGCYSVWIAIESGSQKMLKKIKKPLDLAIVKPLVDEFKRHEIRVSGFFLIGLPGETEEDILQTIEYARQLDLDYSTFSIAQPLPGTELYSMCFGHDHYVDFTNIKFARGDYTLSDLDRDYLEELRQIAWQTVNT